MLALGRFQGITPIEPLRMHLLTASMQFLQRAMAAPGVVRKKTLRARPRAGACSMYH